ncbi:Uncharacterised protein [Mycobacterium tuberculosis]|nr:Uncharacterised protein [Mycobacterium tuberculosis]
MPSRTRLCSAIFVSSVFLNLMLPALARVLPQIRSSSVVLPAPLGPITVTISPSFTCRRTPCTASTVR